MKIHLTKVGEIILNPKHDGFFQYPTPFHFSKDRLGIIYTNRINNQSIANYVLLDKLDLKPAHYSYHNPLLPLGKLGTFTENGATIQYIKACDSQENSLYKNSSVLGTGYVATCSVPYRTNILTSSISFSTSGDFLFAKEVLKVPTSKEDVISTCTPAEVNGEMLYNSHTFWVKEANGEYNPSYCIRSLNNVLFSSWNTAYTRPWSFNYNDDSILCISSRELKNFRTGSGGYKPEFYLMSGSKKPAKIAHTVCSNMKNEQMIAYGTVLKVKDSHLFFYNSSFKSNICVASLEITNG